MAVDSDAPTRRLRWIATVLAAFGILGFVFLNYRDPWPPLVPPPLVPETAEPPPLPAGSMPLAPRSALVTAETTAHSTVKDVPAVVETPPAAPITTLPLRLLVTAVQANPARSFARIEDLQSSATRLMFQGQVFEDRPFITLVTIEADAVLLDNHGALERLPLTPGGRRTTGLPGPRSTPASGVERSDEGSITP